MKAQGQNTATTAGESLTVPFVLAVSAPIAVIIGIELLRRVWWTFALYQVAVCLICPAIESRMRGRGWREHAALLGLVERTEEHNGQRLRNRLLLAGALGLLTALVTSGFLMRTRDMFLDPQRLDATLGEWGVSAKRL